jgi:hypothetical protein
MPVPSTRRRESSAFLGNHWAICGASILTGTSIRTLVHLHLNAVFDTETQLVRFRICTLVRSPCMMMSCFSRAAIPTSCYSPAAIPFRAAPLVASLKANSFPKRAIHRDRLVEHPRQAIIQFPSGGGVGQKNQIAARAAGQSLEPGPSEQSEP